MSCLGGGHWTLRAFYAVLVCASATSSDPSTCDTNCTCCKDNLCTDGNVCDEGCKDGFYGPTCTEQCPLNCATCQKPHSYHTGCLSCKAGFYGKNCELPCPAKCLNSTCIPFNATCSDGCVPGYSGDMCCTKDGPCVRCLHATSCMICRGNFTGSRCEFCPRGTHGRSCDETCSENCYNNVCDRETGICSEGCFDGQYGEFCSETCPPNCKSSTCDRNTGVCINGCKPNFTGDKCYTDGETWYKDTESLACCPCRNTCKDNRCSAEDSCSDGCELGYYGNGCKGKCDHKQRRCVACEVESGGQFLCKECKTGYYLNGNSCVHCSYNCINGLCYPSSGHCTNGCTEGHWGEKCYEICGSNCFNGTCDPSSGECRHGCRDGYLGDTCDDRCGQNCEKCTREGKCLRCEAERYEEDCSGRCSHGCIRTKGELRCNMSDGSCPLGCTSRNLHGKQCDLDCSDNCKDSECDWLTGKCSKGCQDNMFSDFCNQICSNMCESIGDLSVCYDTNGTCIEGCVNGYYDDLCEESCNANCINGTCDRTTGECVHGCLSGYAGAFCSQALSSSATGYKLGLTTVVVVTSVCLFVLVGIGACLVVRQKRKRNREEHHPATKDNNEPADPPANTYENVQMEPGDDTFSVDTVPGASNGDIIPAEPPYHMYKSVDNDEPRAATDNNPILDYEEPQTKTHAYEDLNVELFDSDVPYSELGEMQKVEEIIYINTKL